MRGSRRLSIAGSVGALLAALAATPAARAHEIGDLCPIEVLPTDRPRQAFSSQLSPLSVPAYNSFAGAPVTIYLDFLGDTTSDWNGYNPGTTPAYDIDGDPTTFSSTELANIQNVWGRVAEKYSPFNVNVTTVDPGTLTKFQAMRLVIGGDGKNGQSSYWYQVNQPYGGLSYIGALWQDLPRTGYIFSNNLGGGFPKYVAEASAHEAGHMFDLLHQSVYSGTTKVNEYNPGTAAKAPIMGVSYNSARGIWWKGPSSLLYNSIQADMDGIADPDNNGVTFRDDDHGDTINFATPMDITGTAASASGVIGSMLDKDAFSFSSDGGHVSFEVDPSAYGGMLDATLSLFAADGTLLAKSSTASLSETVQADVPAGLYDLIVSSAGNYGDVGQYTLFGSTVPEPTVILPTIAGVLIVVRRKRTV